MCSAARSARHVSVGSHRSAVGSGGSRCGSPSALGGLVTQVVVLATAWESGSSSEREPASEPADPHPIKIELRQAEATSAVRCRRADRMVIVLLLQGLVRTTLRGGT